MSTLNTFATVCCIVSSLLRCVAAFESCGTDSLNMARNIYHNQRLRSRVIESQPISKKIDCYVKCMKNCRCLSYNVCNEGKLCELNSAKREDDISLYERSDECDYHDFRFNRQQSSGCKDQCCSTSQPCSDGVPCQATCMENGRRFLCLELPRSCAYYANSPNQTNGLRLVYAPDDTPYYAYCRLDEPGSTQTLVMSYSLENQAHFKQQPLGNDYPVSEDSQNWYKYRLSFARMAALRDASNNFQFTCAYDVLGMHSANYIRLSRQNFDPFYSGYSGMGCIQVQRIRILGVGCDHCIVPIVQGNNAWHMIHGQIQQCPAGTTQVVPDKKCSEGNARYFGNYDERCVDENFSCTSSAKATTQLWFVH